MSSLTVLSKLFEKLIYFFINEFFQNNSLIANVSKYLVGVKDDIIRSSVCFCKIYSILLIITTLEKKYIIGD